MDVVDNLGENTSIAFDPAVSEAVIMTRTHGKFVHLLFTGRYEYLIFSNFPIYRSSTYRPSAKKRLYKSLAHDFTGIVKNSILP